MKKLLLLIISILLFNSSLEATTYYVKQNGTGTGTDWNNALSGVGFRTALSNALSGDIFYVAAGTYKPTDGTNRDATFMLKAGVGIYGGFAANSTGSFTNHAAAMSARNIPVNETILSGDLNGNDVINGAGATLSITNNDENIYHVVTVGINASPTNTILDGCIVKGGNANGNTDLLKSGGGIVTVGNAGLRLANCTLLGNSALIFGGGVSISPNSVITDCTFSKNIAAYGGGIYTYTLFGYSLLVSNCTFSENSVSGYSTYAGSGGGIYITSSSIDIVNCTFTANSASSVGGGLLILITILSDVSTITNCTFSGNTANQNGGGIYSIYSSPIVTNCIFWGNTASSNNQIYTTVSTDYTYCVIQDGTATFNGPGNIFADPLLQPLANNGGQTKTMALVSGSSAIGAGTPSKIINSTNVVPATDQRGVVRDDPPCIGAYEFSLPPTHNPFIDLVEKYKVDPIIICETDTIVSFNIEKIRNKGDADLTIDRTKITNKLSWETVISLDAPLNNNIYTLVPNDSSIISIQYKIPANTVIRTYYDTITIWHNDTLRPNPWKIYISIPLNKLEVEINPNVIDFGDILNTDSKKDTVITLVNKNNVPITFSNLSCSSTLMNYTFVPSSGTIPPKGIVKVTLSYVPKSDTAKGQFQDAIEITLDCAKLRIKPILIGALDAPNPHIVSIEKYKIDTINICGGDTTVKFNLEKIMNKGTANLIVYQSKLANKLGWNAILTLDAPLTDDDYIIAPKDSFTINVQYKIPHDISIKTYYDTISIWHNDTLRPNPLEIYVEIPLNKLDIEIKPDLTDLGKILNTDIKKDTVIVLVNKHNVPISFNNISCSSTVMNYSFKPSSGIILAKDSLKITVSYSPNPGALIGPFNNEITINLDCAKLRNQAAFTGKLEHNGSIDTNLVYIYFPAITLCDSGFALSYIDGKLHSNTTINNIGEFYGKDKDLFTYTKSHELPFTVGINDIFELKFKAISTLYTVPGIKTANIELLTTLEGKTKLNIISLTIEIVPGIIATPSSLDFGTVQDNEQLTKKIDVVNQAPIDKQKKIKIKNVYLCIGENFVLSKTIPGGNIIQKDSVLVSLKPTNHGLLEDTVIIVVAYPLCEDTLKIPITAKINSTQETRNVPIDFGKITLCDFVSSGFNIAYVSPKDKYTIDSIKAVYGVDKDLFTYTKSHNLPCNLEENDTFKLNLKVQSSLLTSLGNKTAFLELYTTENGKPKIYILNLKAEVVPGITSTPSSIDFGTVQDNEQLTKKIDVVNQAPIDKQKNVKVKEVNLRIGENFVLSKTISAGTSIQKDSVLVSLKPTKYGVLEDTVIIVIAYPLCEDTFKIPLKVVVQSVPTEKNKLQIIASKHKLVSPSSLNYKIPIYITSSANLTNFKIDTLVLNLNKTLYHLLSVDKGVFSTKYVDSNCEISISDILVPSAKPNVQEVLLTLSGNVLLGNTDSTAITVSRCIINNSISNELDLQHGYLTLSICESGNDRLLRQSNYVPNVTVIENPVNSALLTLECIVIESGNYSLEIIDVLGNVHILKEWNVNVNDGNKFRFSIPTDNYGNGNYIVVMTTPSAKYNTRFLILKY